MVPFISFFVVFLCSLVAMAFYTLFERKLLGHAQVRKGPSKVGWGGILQPFSDAMKLFLKQLIVPLHGNYFGFFVGPVLGLFLSLVIWSLCPFVYSPFFFVVSGMLFLMVSSLGVYGVLLAGWCSNSKYALLGVMRSVAQTISYEISMAFILLCGLLVMSSLSFSGFLYASKVWPSITILPVCIMWLVTLLAETNRAPFDFAEGESELVSGFNVEYSAGPFAFIFMAEYTSILGLSVLSVMIFFGSSISWWVSPIFNSFMSIVVWGGVIMSRAALPRMRYDCLMMLTWKCFLPAILGVLMLSICVMGLLV